MKKPYNVCMFFRTGKPVVVEETVQATSPSDAYTQCAAKHAERALYGADVWVALESDRNYGFVGHVTVEIHGGIA